MTQSRGAIHRARPFLTSVNLGAINRAPTGVRSLGSVIVLLLLLLTQVQSVHADAPLLSLEVDSTTLSWQDEFVVKLSIYAPQAMELPAITIDGMDQFKLQGTGKNLFQIPRGKTKRWILTYTLIAAETGNYKIGPAVLMYEGRTYRSNIVFLNIEGPPSQRAQSDPKKNSALPPPPKAETSKAVTKPAEEPKKPPAKEPPTDKKKPPAEEPPKDPKKPPVQEPPEEEKPPVEDPKPAQKQILKPPVVVKPADIGDRILIVMYTTKQTPYQSQGVPVTVKLLSQLPVENLQFLEEADFPGFLRYDFPFTSKPKGEIISIKNRPYASYELVKFLLFPLADGKIEIPPVRCELKVRVPAEDFTHPDTRLTLERSSNALALNVKRSPEKAVVGDYVFRNEIISDEPDSKVVRLILEGTGQLSTFDFPQMKGPHFTARNLGLSTSAKIKDENLHSKKTLDVEILPQNNTTSVVLPELAVREFDPETASLALLKLPALRFRFELPGASPKMKADFPAMAGLRLWWIFLTAALLAAVVYFRNYRPAPRSTHLRLQKLFRKKNLKLHISRSAARTLYQQIMIEIARQESGTASILEALTRHLPQEEWLNVTRGLRKLERNAYSSTKPAEVTYAEMQDLCRKIEALWIQ